MWTLFNKLQCLRHSLATPLALLKLNRVYVLMRTPTYFFIERKIRYLMAVFGFIESPTVTTHICF